MASFNIVVVLFLGLAMNSLARQPFNFLHLTDFHQDPYYNRNGAKSNRCQEDDIQSEKPSYFGRYGCDSPQLLVDFMLERAKDTVQSLDSPPPFILLSGDLITHHLKDHNYNVTQSVFEIFQQTSKEIRLTFPNIPVLLAPGNNDAIHHNQAPTTKEKASFYGVLFENFFNKSEVIKEKLNDRDWKELQRTFMDGGYYKYKHNDDLSVIALNTNYWHSSNWQTNDYRAGWRQIYFLEDTLSKLGENEQVIIFGHIFPGIYYKDERFWNQTYVSRFRSAVWNSHNKILGYLSAHTHHGDVRTVKNYDYSFLQGPFTYLMSSISSLWSSKQIYESYLSILIAPATSPVYGNNPGQRTFYVDIENNQQYYLHSYRDCFLDIYRTIEQRETTFRTAKRSWNFCYNSTQFVDNLKPATLNAFNNELFDNQETLYNWVTSKSGYNPKDKERADDLIDNNYKKNQIISIPKNDWNCQFWCYSQYLLEDEYQACVAKKIQDLNDS